MLHRPEREVARLSSPGMSITPTQLASELAAAIRAAIEAQPNAYGRSLPGHLQHRARMLRRREAHQ